MSFGFRSGAKRRRPFPYDLVLDGQGFMLGRSRGADKRPQAEFVTSEAADLSRVAPTDYDYSAQDPEGERIQPYDDFTLGMGLRIQKAFRDQRYRYTINADLSVPGIWMQGPEIIQVTPGTTDATNGGTHFFEIASGLYALVGRYCLKRQDDTNWVVSKDFGAGKAAVDVAVFSTNATGTTYAYVAMGDSEYFYRFDGTTWTQHGSLYARAFMMVGREFYRAHDTNNLAKVDVDAEPWTAGNWTSWVNRIGDKAYGITRLVVTATGQLIIVKPDGLYTIDGAGEDTPLFPFLRLAADSNNGKGYGAFLNELYIPFRQALWRLDANLVGQPAGLETLTDNDTPVRGRVTAFAGHDTHHAYAAVYNGTDSYLCKMTPKGIWHGSISLAFSGVQITALFKSTIGAPASHARMYFLTSAGTVGWFVLANDANPAADSVYRFTVATGEIYPATFTAGVSNDQKVIYAATVNGIALSSSDYVQVEYRKDASSGSYTALGNNFDQAREQASFANGTNGTLIDWRFLLVGAAATSSPLVAGVGIHHAWRPLRREIYTFNVLIADGLTRWDNTPLRVGRTKLLSVLEAARDTVGSVTLIMPDHTAKEVTLISIGQTEAWNDRVNQWQSAVQVRCIAFGAVALYGTHARMMNLGSHTVMQKYTHGQLMRF